MNKLNLAIISLALITLSISCRSFMPAKTSSGPAIDFTTPGKGLHVQVQLDKKQTASGKITKAGGTVSLTSADGSKFTLDVPANALESETEIVMTAVKTLDGAPLDNNTPTAVQLEPSGLFFKELVTLTVMPAKEIPIKEQIAFSYEGDGKDYHLALVDPKSKHIEIKLMEFSGAGVGSGSDAAWAVNLQIQAETARTRLNQKAGEITQRERIKQLLGDESGAEEWAKQIESLMDQYDDQVLRKEMVAAELDCRFARRAIQNILGAERQRQLLGVNPDPNIWQNVEKLVTIGAECKKAAAFQIVGGLDDWQTSTKVCDILQPFTLTGGGFRNEFSGGLAGTYSYSGPFNAKGTGTYTISLPDGLDKPGTMTGQGEGAITGDKVYTGSGVEKYTLTPIEPCS
jgi:hypothetical protein